MGSESYCFSAPSVTLPSCPPPGDLHSQPQCVGTFWQQEVKGPPAMEHLRPQLQAHVSLSVLYVSICLYPISLQKGFQVAHLNTFNIIEGNNLEVKDAHILRRPDEGATKGKITIRQLV